MTQLDLFHGPHLPLMRCLAALDEGDLRRAGEALAGAEPGSRAAADRERLAAIDAALSRSVDGGPLPPEQVHAAFAAALTEGAARCGPGEIPPESWFRSYARHIAAALETAAGARFRGWCALHFALAGGDSAGALRSGLRLVSRCDEGWAWLETARVAWAVGEAERAARWVIFACLKDDGGVDPAPPRIATVAASALNPPPGALPRLPRAVEDLWAEVEALDLPGPASAWVPAVGIIDGTFPPSLLGWSTDLAGSGFDPAEPSPGGEPEPRTFLRALVAARRARSAAAGTGYGHAELSARVEMKRLAPSLLARYLARLSGGPPRS